MDTDKKLHIVVDESDVDCLDVKIREIRSIKQDCRVCISDGAVAFTDELLLNCGNIESLCLKDAISDEDLSTALHAAATHRKIHVLSLRGGPELHRDSIAGVAFEHAIQAKSGMLKALALHDTKVHPLMWPCITSSLCDQELEMIAIENVGNDTFSNMTCLKALFEALTLTGFSVRILVLRAFDINRITNQTTFKFLDNIFASIDATPNLMVIDLMQCRFSLEMITALVSKLKTIDHHIYMALSYATIILPSGQEIPITTKHIPMRLSKFVTVDTTIPPQAKPHIK